MATALAHTPVLRTPALARLTPALARVAPRTLTARVSTRAPIAMAVSSPPAVEMWVKGDPKTETLQDCACAV